jgi:leucyl aminopeptidase
MTTPSLSVVDMPAQTIDADVLVLGVRSGEDGPSLVSELAALAPVRSALAAIGVTGARDELTRLPVEGIAASSIALVGLGKGEPSVDDLRSAAGTAARQLLGVESIAFALPVADEDAVLAVLEGAAVGAYSYLDSKGRSKDKAKRPASSIIVASDLTVPAAIRKAEAIAEAMGLVRDLVNMPPGSLYPETFANAAIDALREVPVEVTVLAQDELEAEGFGGILGVGRGSTRGPRLVRLDYTPSGATAHLALVGKGITFDSGGLSLKPAASMVGMKYDMAGAASVLGTILAAARLQLPVRLSGWLCLAENMPSGEAMRPNDVITIRGGTTVEVLNTDAEGRLVLADGLVAASETSPDAIIDIATLTGAAIVALGNRYSGVMGADALVADVCTAATKVGDRFWPMPLPEELRSGLNSDIADIANARIGNSAGGMLLAGVFLKEFVGTSDDGARTIPWAHIDIAGTANNSGSGFGFTGKGASGIGVRALLELATEFSGA